MSEKRGHSAQNVHSSYKYRGKFQASVPRDTMIPLLSPHVRARALCAACWLPHAFEDVKEVAARPWCRPYTNQLTGHVVFQQV